MYLSRARTYEQLWNDRDFLRSKEIVPAGIEGSNAAIAWPYLRTTQRGKVVEFSQANHPYSREACSALQCNRFVVCMSSLQIWNMLGIINRPSVCRGLTLEGLEGASETLDARPGS